MNTISTQNKKLILSFGAILGWSAIITQLILIIDNRAASITETIIRFFSFFTILTNILVAFCCTVLLCSKQQNLKAFFERSTTLTAITLYIVVVGLVYNCILRFLWAPQGLQKLTDELLHTVIPLLFLFFWVMYVPKNSLQYRNILPWLIYPTVYCIYTLLRGAFIHYYPYPFLNANVLGYKTVVINICGLVLVFVVLGLGFIFVGKKSNPNFSWQK